jgi:phosphocarrier protein
MPRGEIVSEAPTSGALEIVNSLGLHARAASKLVALANRYDSEVFIGRDGTEVNAKSILGVLMLACPEGSVITVRCEGPQAAAAYAAIAELVASGFGET